LKKKIKIFLYNPYPAIGGVDTTIKNFFQSLDNNYAIEYITLKKTKRLKKTNINYTVINSSSTFRSFFKIYKIFKEDTHEKKFFFSIQYFVNIWSIIFIKLLLKGKLFIYEVNHLNEFNYSNSIKEFIKKNIIKILIKILYRFPDIVASNSSELSYDLSKYVKRKVYTLYNPSFKKIIFRKKTYKLNNKINLLNIARFENQKDHFTLLKAINYSGIKDKINLVLVGYGTNYEKIKNYIKKNKINGKIFINDEKLDKYYKKTNLYVCSSLYEGLPTTVIEAASYCLPIISSNFKSGSKEIFLNGKAGFIFKVRDYKKLSKILLQFYTNPKLFYKKELICRSNLNRFSVKKNTDLFKKFISKLI
jgi:glycosyltransferase involved in cell wall biosynthesis